MLEIDVREIESILVQCLVSTAGRHVLHLPELGGAPGGAVGDVLGVTPPHHISLRHILTQAEVVDTLLERRHYPPLYVDYPERIRTRETYVANSPIIKSEADRILHQSCFKT